VSPVRLVPTSGEDQARGDEQRLPPPPPTSHPTYRENCKALMCDGDAARGLPIRWMAWLVLALAKVTARTPFSVEKGMRASRQPPTDCVRA